MAETGASPLPPTRSALTRAEHFVWLTARVLEQRRFAYHFIDGGDGGADAVETALAAYRNEDDGYGHALEPDLRGPTSQPLHTAHALHVLDSIGRCGGQRVERVCRYLTSVSTPDGALPAVHPSQRGYPAAPFVPIPDTPTSSLLATAPVVGLLHRNEVWHAWLFRATDFCWQAIESLQSTHPYEAEAAVAFLDSAPDRSRAQTAADRLGRLVRDQNLVALTPAHLKDPPVSPGYAPTEHHFPHNFAPTPNSLARAWFTDEEMTHSLNLLTTQQHPDGGWPITWHQWSPTPTQESRPRITLDALLTLRAYGRPLT
ncbi:hypothetical protein OK074_7718 [Actinobacteria bacterium OK074]|nr:hypothetical protein OK074_7718 [Actinobacteria bacterium OK074]